MADVTYDVWADATYKSIAIVEKGATVTPLNSTIIGEYTRPDTDNKNQLGPDINHVLYHAVRDIVYAKTGLGISDATIEFLDYSNPVISITTLNQVEVRVGGTISIAPTFTPANATNRNVTWATSDATLATVDTDGIITGVKVGLATITCTTVDGAKVSKTFVNVVADTIG